MEQALYQWIRWIASKYELSGLVQQYESQLLAGLLLAAILSCFVGFSCYRGAASALACLAVVSIAGAWVRPAWGPPYAATICAELGVVFAFLTFRWVRLSSVTLAAVIAGGLVWQGTGSWPVIPAVIAVAVSGLAAGGFTLLFPVWGICGCTALWGGIGIAARSNWRIGLLCTAAGFCLQLYFFRNQKLFPRIMPMAVENRLKNRKAPRG